MHSNVSLPFAFVVAVVAAVVVVVLKILLAIFFQILASTLLLSPHSDLGIFICMVIVF